MTAIDTSPEAVERIASIIVKPLSTLKESFEAAALLRALSGELARARELVTQLCAVRDRLKHETDDLRYQVIEVTEERDHLRQALAKASQGPSHG